jgi:hypothetical protein
VACDFFIVVTASFSQGVPVVLEMEVASWSATTS